MPGFNDNGWTIPTAPDEMIEQFEAALAQASSGREAKHRISDEKYAAMMLRLVRGFEKRAMYNPAILPLAQVVEKRMGEVVNVACAFQALRFRRSPFLGLSKAELAKVLCVKESSMSQRISIGLATMAERAEAAGIVVLARQLDKKAKSAELAREVKLIEQAKEATVVSLAAWRERSAAAARKAA